MVEDIGLEILKGIKDIQNGTNKDDFILKLTRYIKFLEIYIVGQMITTDNDVANYVSKNTDNIDSTASCIVQFFNRTLEEMKKSESVKNQ